MATPSTPADAVDTRRAALRTWLRRCGILAAFAALTCLGTALTVSYAGSQTFRWRAFDIQVRMFPSMNGSTELRFIPVGVVHAATHRAPVTLQISLMNIDFDAARKLISKPPPPKLLEIEFRRTARHDLNQFAMRQLLLGAIGGLLAPLLLRPRWRWAWVISALAGAMYVSLTVLVIGRSFDPSAFQSPTYTGALKQAPWAIALARDGFNKVEALSAKLRNVASNLSRLYDRINAVPSLVPDNNTITVLHISDMHNNPGAVSFVQQLVQGMHADMVVDTGDLTDFGLPLEADITKGISEIKVPDLFVAGNHDSLAVIAAVRKNPNAHVLNGIPLEVDGLTFIGDSDPASQHAGAHNVDTSPAELAVAGQKLLSEYVKESEPSNIICVHDPIQAAPLIGKASLILCGHEHRSYIDIQNGTVICNAGTTGAAGGRYFDHENGVAMTASVLSFSKGPRPRLLFIDRIVLEGSLGEYSIIRKSFSDAGPMQPTAAIPEASKNINAKPFMP